MVDTGVTSKTGVFNTPRRVSTLISTMKRKTQEVYGPFDVSDAVTCSVCFNVCAPQIQQCHNGHIWCEACAQEINKRSGDSIRCPTCNEKCKPTRALGLEKVLGRLQFKVRCPHEDCGEQVKYADFFNHKDSCEHRPIRFGGVDIPPSKFLASLYEDEDMKAEVTPVLNENEYSIQLSWPESEKGILRKICRIGVGLHLFFYVYQGMNSVNVSAYSTCPDPFDIEVVGPRAQVRFTLDSCADLRKFSSKVHGGGFEIVSSRLAQKFLVNIKDGQKTVNIYVK